MLPAASVIVGRLLTATVPPTVVVPWAAVGTGLAALLFTVTLPETAGIFSTLTVPETSVVPCACVGTGFDGAFCTVIVRNCAALGSEAKHTISTNKLRRKTFMMFSWVREILGIEMGCSLREAKFHQRNRAAGKSVDMTKPFRIRNARNCEQRRSSASSS